MLCVHVAAKILNLDISRCRLVGYVRQRMLHKCVPHVQHDSFSSFNIQPIRSLFSSVVVAVAVAVVLAYEGVYWEFAFKGVSFNSCLWSSFR